MNFMNEGLYFQGGTWKFGTVSSGYMTYTCVSCTLGHCTIQLGSGNNTQWLQLISLEIHEGILGCFSLEVSLHLLHLTGSNEKVVFVHKQNTHLTVLLDQK